MNKKVFPALIPSAAACLIMLGGCLFDSGGGKSRISETVPFNGYIGVIYEYSVSDSGTEVTGDSIGLGYTSSAILIRADTANSNSGLFAISLEKDTVALIFTKADSTETFRLKEEDCKFSASATALIPITGDTLSAPLKFSQSFLVSTGISFMIDVQKSKPSTLDSVDFNQKAISGSYTISCPDPR